MSQPTEFKTGDKVVFQTGGPHSFEARGEIIGKTEDGRFFKTKDDAGKERKIRPGALRKAA